MAKFALATPQRLLSVQRYPTAKLTKSTLKKILKESPINRVIMASVVPKATLCVSQFFKKEGLPLLSINSTTDLGITLRYPHPSSIGADRLANAVATTALYGSPAIVVDFGTAITFDIINNQGAYIGGIIAPGLTTGAKALHHHTALLPCTTPSPIRRALGKSTLAAIHSGLLLGARGLVREVITRITKENFANQPPIVIATGGDAKLVAQGTTLFNVVSPELTLEGLREIGKRLP